MKLQAQCITINTRFSGAQGGCDPRLRAISLHQLIKRDCPGYAIGGLVGGESKEDFWRTVAQCTAGAAAKASFVGCMSCVASLRLAGWQDVLHHASRQCFVPALSRMRCW